jgi:hypothetical protein
MATFHSLIAPNEAHLGAIGRVAIQWTFLEKLIESVVWELASLKQPYAQAVTTHISNQQLIDTANALAYEKLSGTILRQQLNAQLNHIKNHLRPKRNSIVHGIWGPCTSPHKISYSETTARGEVKFKSGDEMTADDILDIAAEIDLAHFELTKLAFEISFHLGQVTTIEAK